MIIRDMDGSFKWTHEGRSSKYPKKGIFTAAGATVAWARMGPRDVCGYVLDSCGNDCRWRPMTRLVVSTCTLCALVGLLVAGGWYLKRAATWAREESDALVEMLRKKVDGGEVVAHV